MSILFQIDKIITKYINSLNAFGSAFDRLMKIMSDDRFLIFLLTVSIFIVAISFYLLWKRIGISKRLQSYFIFESLRFLLLVGISTVIVQVIKQLAHRARPYEADLEIILRQSVDLSDSATSMPSAHTALAFILTFFFIFGDYPKTIKVTFIILAILIATSRIYLGMHFFSDILVSILITLSLVVSFNIYQKKI